MMFFQLGSRGYQRELRPNVMSGWQPVVWCLCFSACEMDGKLLTLFWNGTGNSRRTRRGYMSLLTKQQGLRWMEPKGTVRASLLLLQFAMRLDVFQSKLLSRLTADRQQAAETVVEKKNKTWKQCHSKAGVVAESQPITGWGSMTFFRGCSKR